MQNKKGQRKLTSWIDSFRQYNRLRPTSDKFLLWSAASAVASTLQRRVFCTLTGMKLFPNPYIILIGGPGTGKSVAIGEARRFAQHTTVKDYIRVAPDATSREAFFQIMEKSYNVKMKIPSISGEDMLDRKHSSLSIMSSELGSLLQTNNMPFLRALADLYDCDRPGDIYDYILKTAESSIIQKPWLSILGGTTPVDLAQILPEQPMGQGFTSRLILVWDDEEYETDDLFKTIDKEYQLQKDLLHDYHLMLELEGEYVFTKNASDWLNSWNDNKKDTMPTDTMLINYCTRRLVHLVKLCMIAAVSNKQELKITEADCEEAWGWLTAAEDNMSNAIRGIGMNPLSDQIAQLVGFIHAEFKRTKKPVREAVLRRFVTRNVPIDRAAFYINEMEQYCLISAEKPFRLFEPMRKT